MRLSVNENQPHEYVGARIYLDGIERTDVIAADEEARFIDMYCRDEFGAFILYCEEIKTQRLHGLVRIDLPSLS